MSRNLLFLALALAIPFSIAPAQAATTHFTIRIENISKTNQFVASNGTKWTLDFSRGAYAVTNDGGPLFTAGTKYRSEGLRSLAEDGDPTTLGISLARSYGSASGKFVTAVGAMKPGGIRPGHAFEFTVTASPQQRLYFATMFGQSNDWFYAPNGNGIALFDRNGRPIVGDITSQVKLWDAGTKADEELGIGPHQGPRELYPGYGSPDPNPIVRLATSDPRFLDVSNVMRVTVKPQ